MSLSIALDFFFLLFFIFPSGVVPEGSGGDNSAVSFTVCEDFDWVAGEGLFTIEVRSNSTDQSYTAHFGQDGTKTKDLDGKIDQQDVKFVKYESTKEMCFQSLVVDTTIIIDQPTFLNSSCDDEVDDDNELCKEWGSELPPVAVCPEMLTKLLKDKGDLSSMPSTISGATDFQPPVYDITNDMAQASGDIAEGTSEIFRKYVKHKWKALGEAKKVRFSDLGRKLESFNSFMGAFGPMFSIFSGITSIVTNFLTPNPFDELANYLKQEFSAINRRLSHIQSDIADVKRVVENQGNMAGMAGKLQAIRYSLRAYETMVKKLTEDKVCGASNLFNQTEIRHFMEQYKSDRVDDSLLDLFGVEFGDVLESSTLLTALMRAYCNTNIAKVQQFMEGVIDYAVAGSLAHSAYQSLECRMEGRQDCDEDEDVDNEWNRKLYRFLKKANALKEAITDPGYGLQLDIQDDVDKLIYDELAANPNQFNGLFDKVFTFVMNKLTDINDWPEACMYNLHDKVVIVEVAELENNVTTYDRDMRPWYLEFPETGNKLRKFRYHVKQGDEGSYTRQNLPGSANFYCHYANAIPTSHSYFYNYECSVRFTHRPDSNDWVISFLYSPNSYQIKASDQQNDQVTPSVFVKRQPLYVYYTSDETIMNKIGRRMYLAITKASFGYRGVKPNAAFIDASAFQSRHEYEPAA